MSEERSTFFPIEQMWRRVDRSREDSDSLAFEELMLAGELLLKLTVVGLLGAVADSPKRHRYRQLHAVVRSDGIGDWVQVLDEILTGPTSQFLREAAEEEQLALTRRCDEGTWQHDVVTRINTCLRRVNASADPVPKKVAARRWFLEFVELRNKTRGHGAILSGAKAELAVELSAAFTQYSVSFPLFKRQWAHLHRNYSGKYRVTYLHQTASRDLFEPLKTSDEFDLENGVYVDFGEPTALHLVSTDVDRTDLFLANGGFNGRKFEMLSYISGSRYEVDATPYLIPTSDLPASHTQGLDNLDVVPGGEAFTNLPSLQLGYVSRPGLETMIVQAVCENPATIVTLVGKGGIGKTSLAIAVLNALQMQPKFDAILWFSARDIDLLPDGPRTVRADVLDHADIAKDFGRLLPPENHRDDNFDPLEYFRQSLEASPTGGPLLFVFDNFETVKNPAELFHWLYTYLRPPNKVLVTTRHRDFNGDFGITVGGMTFEEGVKLITQTAASLHIPGLLSDEHVRRIFREADGHPYVMKVLVGEAAKTGRPESLRSLFAGSDEILSALFERTYANLSPIARRAFLTLCDWKSPVAEIALEAVLIGSADGPIDVREAVRELYRSSFVELHRSESDETDFLSVPLVARLFGERKLAVSPTKPAIEVDRGLLEAFGAVTQSDLRRGFAPRIDRFLASLARRSETPDKPLLDYKSMLEFIGRRYHAAWPKVAALYAEGGDSASLEESRRCLERYLEQPESPEHARQMWVRQAELSHKLNDAAYEAHALVEASCLPKTSPLLISQNIYRLNSLFAARNFGDGSAIRHLALRLAEVMEQRIEEADATALSNLAWLWLHLGRQDRAEEVVRIGLSREPDNSYCIRLADRFGWASV